MLNSKGGKGAEETMKKWSSGSQGERSQENPILPTP